MNLLFISPYQEVRRYTSKDVKFPEYKNEWDYICKMFDFSVCKVAYHPRTKKLLIHNQDDLTQKKATFHFSFISQTRQYDNLSGRIEKYSSREFTMINLDHSKRKRKVPSS